MEELFGRRVHLFLFVKVREDWAENREHYARWVWNFLMNRCTAFFPCAAKLLASVNAVVR